MAAFASEIYSSFIHSVHVLSDFKVDEDERLGVTGRPAPLIQTLPSEEIVFTPTPLKWVQTRHNSYCPCLQSSLHFKEPVTVGVASGYEATRCLSDIPPVELEFPRAGGCHGD